MPSSATITSFYNFTANTKARASQVNNNFDVIRGHFIPIHVSTATSANNTYDLGSYEYRWRKAYAYDLEIGSTSTNSATINIDTATTTAEIVFKINGTEKARINANGVIAPYSLGATTSAAIGQIGLSSQINFGSGGVTYNAFQTISANRVSIQTSGKPVLVSLLWQTLAGAFVFSANTSTGAFSSLVLNRGTSEVSRKTVYGGVGAFNAGRLTTISWVDIAPAGTHSYDIGMSSDDTTGAASWSNYKIFAKELF